MADERRPSREGVAVALHQETSGVLCAERPRRVDCGLMRTVGTFPRASARRGFAASTEDSVCACVISGDGFFLIVSSRVAGGLPMC
jgi:hypothetical protein